MKYLLVSPLLFLFFWEVQSEENCDKLGILLYEDLGCKPVLKLGQKCPVKYECGDLSLKPDSCTFQGKSLKLGEAADDDVVYDSCNTNCRCFNSSYPDPIPNKASFNCAMLDCPEWLGAWSTPKCYRKYELGKCCATGEVCPPFDVVPKCEYDGETYKLGERFDSKDSCSKCVCQEGFKGILEEPFCKRESCSVQIRRAKEVSSNCAPIYSPHREVSCCPSYSWACPSKDKDDKIIKIKTDADESSELKCKWGDKEVQLGFGIETNMDFFSGVLKIQCECVVPPFLKCKPIP